MGGWDGMGWRVLTSKERVRGGSEREGERERQDARVTLLLLLLLLLQYYYYYYY